MCGIICDYGGYGHLYRHDFLCESTTSELVYRSIAMTRQHSKLVYLVNDPICLLLMARDGVQPRSVYRMMKSVRPMISQPV